MSISSLAPGTKFQFPLPREEEHHPSDLKRVAAMTAELQELRAGQRSLLAANADLLQRQDTLAVEFEHRLVNGLQTITALLSLQSRNATPEAAEQLAIAARRVAAFGRVHRRLHLLDHKENVEFKQYLRLLCDDLSGLLFPDKDADRSIVVGGAAIEVPTATAIPLGFIANELITNAAKYGRGNITIRIGISTAGCLLSVLDEGPGLPAGFDPSRSRGLGMKIVQSFAKQIGGVLEVAPGDNSRGAQFTVTFKLPNLGATGLRSTG